MQLSTRGRYAVMAMACLASRSGAAGGCDCAPTTIADIADSQRLSQAYLEQLFARLRRAGLVTSARGPGGGYRLARPACAMTICDIVAAVDENLEATRCEPGGDGCIRRGGSLERCQTHDLWAELGRQIRLFLDGVTLDDVISQRVAGRAVRLPEPA